MKPYFECESGKLYCGDCLEVLPNLSEIDLVLTDPPYNISKENNFTTMGRAGVDFGEWDKEADILSYIELLPNVINKNSSVIVFNDWKNLGDIARKLEESNFDVKDCIRMIKRNPMPRNIERRYVTDYEFAVWAVNHNSKWVFNKQKETYDIPEIKCSLVSQKDRTKHPTQKPLNVMEELVLRHSNEKDVVLDPFCGSGTTAVAAIRTGRRFICIEKEKAYCDITVKRIKEELQKNSLFLC